MMPSSRESARPLLLPDLREDIPAGQREEFVEQVEFADVQNTYRSTPTPDEAYQAGLAEGEHAGRAAALKELAPVLGRFEELIRSLTHVREQKIDEAESDLVEIGTSIASRILHGELELSSDAVLRLARACIEEAKEEGTRTLRVNPADVELVRAHLPDLESDMTERELTIEADPQIPPGGVVLETSRACYDGRPERILAAVSRQLHAAKEPEP